MTKVSYSTVNVREIKKHVTYISFVAAASLLVWKKGFPTVKKSSLD